MCVYQIIYIYTQSIVYRIEKICMYRKYVYIYNYIMFVFHPDLEWFQWKESKGVGYLWCRIQNILRHPGWAIDLSEAILQSFENVVYP